MLSQLLPRIANEAPPGNEDECGDGLLAAEKREDFAEKINLDLGIGSFARRNEGGLKRNLEIKREKEESLFTDAQFHEFYSQILVFNSITSRLAVPFHLFLPIWMSVFNSLGPAIYQIYPTFIGFSPQNRDHSSVMDPEPGRCKRTDGRKWRCSKNVVPHQKYCERHMHRGRQCSRKHVEHIESGLKVDNKTSDDTGMLLISSTNANADNRIAASIPSDLNPSQACLDYNNSVPANVKCRNDKIRDALLPIQATLNACTLGNEVSRNENVVCASMISCSNSVNNGATNGGGRTEGKVSGFENANPKKISSTNNVAPRFGSSPKSVLHCDAGKVGLDLVSANVTETEPQRCRRTDGKKWQCRRGAVPNQKYCEAHMHRGAKRLKLNPESVGDVPDTSRKAHISCTAASNLGNGINLNDIPASPRYIITGDNSTSSTSDATTITDENISFCLAQSLHN